MADIRINVGENIEDTAARAVKAWHRIEQGEQVDERHVTFANWETMVRIMSPKRLELLRHVHQHPARSIRALSQALQRDYRRVHEDVEALQGAGLVDRGKDGLSADYAAFDVSMRVAL